MITKTIIPKKGNSIWNITVLCIVSACIILALLKHITSSSSSNDSSPNVYRDPQDDLFLIAHTLDPTFRPDAQYLTWRRAQWLNWLNQRETIHARVASRMKINRRNQLNRKPLNTVIISTPQGILETFSGNLNPYYSQFVWSNRRVVTFEFTYNKYDGTHRIFRCLEVYVAVKLINGKPVHLATVSLTRIPQGNTHFSRSINCFEIFD